MKNHLRLYLSAFALVIGFTVAGVSAQTAPGNFANIKIRNFGQMDTNYYRGAQPKENEYAALKALGITTIIDLQEKPTRYEKSTAESLGMKYINIPMDDATYPPQAAIDQFLKEINDPANGVMYVHCKGGKHRTGVTGAVYRFTKYGWDYDKVMTEMENYNFDTSWGRKVMKDFVVDYAAKMKTNQGATMTAAK
ncbi:MAG TPA: tyrosine-protein phosphatase [Pyrinomonadaceae bacterium]|nr:tyrosine-protein phosphatase [Pyrinomonadaceae bacterium]